MCSVSYNKKKTILPHGTFLRFSPNPIIITLVVYKNGILSHFSPKLRKSLMFVGWGSFAYKVTRNPTKWGTTKFLAYNLMVEGTHSTSWLRSAIRLSMVGGQALYSMDEVIHFNTVVEFNF